MILQEFARLKPWPALALMCRAKAPRIACSCTRICCSGFKPNEDWAAAVDALCFILKHEAELSRKRGKKGLSTHPALRRSLVERFFDPARRFVLRELAESVSVSEMTVMVHKKPIEEFLRDQEQQGWQELDLLLQEAGIVGATS